MASEISLLALRYGVQNDWRATQSKTDLTEQGSA